MRCVICKTGFTHPGEATATTLQRGRSVIVIRDVPAEVREDCGEYYLNDPTNPICSREAAKTRRKTNALGGPGLSPDG